MANKTADQILYDFSRYVRHHERTGLGGEGINSIETSRQLYEMTLEIIGDDWRPPLSPLNKAYQTKREGVNFEKAKQRAKARAFYGISETEGSAEEGVCEICDVDYPVWIAPSPLWNKVMRNEKDYERHAFVCLNCFAKEAEKLGIKPTAWLLTEEELAPATPQLETEGEEKL